jgi:hypothetical protein
MAKKKTKTYTPAPAVPSELQDRYRAILEVLSGELTVSEAARRLDMPRNHFQTLMHRGLAGLIEGVTPAKAGRPAKPEKQAELEKEVDRLRRKTAQLEQRLEMTDKLMGLASSLLHGTTTARPRSKRTKAEMTSADDKSEEEPAPLRALARQLDELGLPRALVARALRVPESTLRRLATTEPRARASRATPPPVDVEKAAIQDIRELRGLVGAESLRQTYPGLSRRQAAHIKQATLTDMERERRAACSRVVVTVPGVLRGFDAMDRGHAAAPRYVLVAADGCVPYRTSTEPVERYDDASVARVLDADFEEHGAPLVLRLDRAKAHSAPRTAAVLAARGVLVLHGPPHHPRFYGQLERQNREHSAWVHDDHGDDHEPFEVRMRRMRDALNVRWRRRALDWRTPEEVWRTRPAIDVVRRELHAVVAATARKLRGDATHDKMSEDLATRLAIEHALTNLGYLRIENRRPLLGDIEVRKQAI